MFGAGEPSAVQGMVASLPSRAVWLEGGWIRIGVEAKQRLIVSKINKMVKIDSTDNFILA